MTNQFHGSIERLQAAVSSTGLVGDWKDNSANNCHQFKARTGEILNWWPSKGTLQYQGKNQDSFKAILSNSLSDVTPTPLIPSIKENGRKIFIVHGHDNEARDQLELILMRLGLQPFILQNSDAGSKTIVEALEAKIYKESALGIILMTPDDFGYKKTQTEADRTPRARQNVILEMGMVMASLGRERMLILKKGALEMPSDAAGILHHEFNDHVKEVVPKLVQRLQHLGFEIDSTKIAAASV